MPIAFAHRGARSERPENTIAAFTRALTLGATGLETDAWLSADGDPVLVHDAVFRRGVRRIRVDRTGTAALLDYDVPSLVGLYDACGTEFELSIDVKTIDAARPVIEVARRVGDPSRLWLCHPSVEFLTELRLEAPDVHLVLSTSRKRLAGSFERQVADLAVAGVDTINLHHTEWTKGLVALAHRFEIKAFAWDVQEVRHLRGVLAMKIDGIYCDDVTRMMSVIGEWSV